MGRDKLIARGAHEGQQRAVSLHNALAAYFIGIVDWGVSSLSFLSVMVESVYC